MADFDLSDAALDLSDVAGGGAPASESSYGERFGNALRSGGRGIADSIATTLDATGIPGGETLRGLRPELPQGYQSPSAEFINQGQPGYNWNKLPEAIAEQGPQLAASVALRMAGGVVGLAGPALFQAAQIVGPVAMERAQRKGNPEPDMEDWAWALGTAIASGALESFGAGRLIERAPGGRGVIGRTAAEFATEGSQSVAEQAGSTARTPGGLEIDPKQALGEGIIGGGAGAPVAVAGRVSERIRGEPGQDNTPSPTEPQTEDDLRLAERLRVQAEESGRDLGIRERTTNNGAFNVASSVETVLKTEAGDAYRAMLRLARSDDDRDGVNDINVLYRKAFGGRASEATDADIERVLNRYGTIADAQKLGSLARQRKTLNQFLREQGTIGGISRYTRMMDPFEKDASGFRRAAGLMTGVGIPGMIINRAAVGIDKLTGNYSPVQKFVKNAEGKAPTEIMGDDALDLADQKRMDKVRSVSREEGSLGAWEAIAKAENAKNGTSFSAQEMRDKFTAEDILAKRRETEQKLRQTEAKTQTLDAKAAVAQAKEQQTARRAATMADLADVNLQLSRGKLSAQAADQRLKQAVGQLSLARGQQGLTNDRLTQTLRELQIQVLQKRLTPQEANEKAKAAVEEATQGEGEASPEAKADPSDWVKKWYKGDEAEANSAIERELTYLRTGRHPDLTVDTNGARRRATQGEATKIARRELRNLFAEAGTPQSTISSIMNVLDQMDDYATSRSEREKHLGQLAEMLSDALDTDPNYAYAERLASTLVEIGPNKPNERESDKPPTPAQDAAKSEPVLAAGALQKLEATINLNLNINGQNVSVPANGSVNVGLNAGLAPSETIDPVAEGQNVTQTAKEIFGDAPVPEEVQKAEDDVEREKEKATGRGIPRTIGRDHDELVDTLVKSRELAPKYAGIRSRVTAMLKSTDTKQRVLGMVLDDGSEFQTYSLLLGRYADEYHDGNQQTAAPELIKTILDIKNEGIVKVLKAQPFLSDGKQMRDKDENYLNDLVLQFNPESPFYKDLEIAKARARMEGIPNVSRPHAPLGANGRFRNNISAGIKGLSDAEISQQTAIIGFVNEMRAQGIGINRPLLDRIWKSLESNPSSLKDHLKGDSKDNLQALAHLKYQDVIGQLKDNVMFQEAHAIQNGRVFFKNGMASSQGADLMKATTRAKTKLPVSPRGLELLFQSWGNVLGFDKENILARRKGYMESIPALLELANNPFPDGDYSDRVKALLKGAEGPFQAIALAMDTKDMVDFIQARWDGNWKPGKILTPEILGDLGSNWKTSALAQFDANNNSFQLVGLFLGEETVLRATGMMPVGNVNPGDESQTVEDVYRAPALQAVAASPTLQGALGKGTADEAGKKWLRKVVKGVVSNYVYLAGMQSATAFVRKKLDPKKGEGYDRVSREWIESEKGNVKNLAEGGVEFTHGRHNTSKVADGPPVKWRIVPNYTMARGKKKAAKGWRVERQKLDRDGNEVRWSRIAAYDDKQLALDHPVLETLSGIMAGQVRHQIGQLYPGLERSKDFFLDLGKVAKDNGNMPVRVPLPDGTVVTFTHEVEATEKTMNHIVYKFKGKDKETGEDYEGQYLLPVEESRKPGGLGLAAFVTHAHDAYVMREAYKRTKERLGGALKGGYNPIHDSHGYHPSEADVGRNAVLEVMAELTQWDIFNQIVAHNPELQKLVIPQAQFDLAVKEELALAMARKQNQGKDSARLLKIATDNANKRSDIKGKFIIPERNANVEIDPRTILNAVS
jgi:hypothetical protein